MRNSRFKKCSAAVFVTKITVIYIPEDGVHKSRSEPNMPQTKQQVNKFRIIQSSIRSQTLVRQFWLSSLTRCLQSKPFFCHTCTQSVFTSCWSKQEDSDCPASLEIPTFWFSLWPDLQPPPILQRHVYTLIHVTSQVTALNTFPSAVWCTSSCVAPDLVPGAHPPPEL